ncbi:class I SAM-dependent methyltransferase [Streptosporangium sp. NPDC002524]|uniref:class I SAM-dependent methyltransferase n=1 Tax=Streptosporangium sp. NPDC002524 TaxID=3154537 RepID=UPI003325EDC7
MDLRDLPPPCRSRTSPASLTVRDRFEWTRAAGIGPPPKVFGDLTGRRVVELGCGGGHNLAHLAIHHHAEGVGIDHAPLKIQRALSPVWCTSWRADAAPLVGSLLGLPTWDHIDLPRLPLTTSHPNGYLWKRDTITQLFTDQPLVWIDDDFTPADHTWAGDRTTTGVLTILIQPNPYLGLTTADLEATGLNEIAEWHSRTRRKGRSLWGIHA